MISNFFLQLQNMKKEEQDGIDGIARVQQIDNDHEFTTSTDTNNGSKNNSSKV